MEKAERPLRLPRDRRSLANGLQSIAEDGVFDASSDDVVSWGIARSPLSCAKFVKVLALLCLDFCRNATLRLSAWLALWHRGRKSRQCSKKTDMPRRIPLLVQVREKQDVCVPGVNKPSWRTFIITRPSKRYINAATIG